MNDGNMLRVASPLLWGDELGLVAEALEAGWISSHGPYVERFERRFAELTHAPFAVATSSGTTALHLALATLGVGPGDEVIVPAFTMIAPVFAVRYVGATPVAVDADATWCMDPDLVQDAITPRTRAIIAVHTYGHPAAVHRLEALASRHGLLLIEDAAEAQGATVCGRPVGTFGDAACFSLYANKLVTTGEGGMLVTRRKDVYERVRWKRNMCFGPDEESRYEHTELGFNYRLTSLQAAFGLAQLNHLSEALEVKRTIAATYRRGLQEIEHLTLPPESAWATNVHWVFGVLLNDGAPLGRAEAQARLRDEGIETRRFFAPVSRQRALAGLLEARTYPAAERLYERGFYLPSGTGTPIEGVLRTAECIRRMLR
jgi:perosamine synthetase